MKRVDVIGLEKNIDDLEKESKKIKQAYEDWDEKRFKKSKEEMIRIHKKIKRKIS